MIVLRSGTRFHMWKMWICWRRGREQLFNRGRDVIGGGKPTRGGVHVLLVGNYEISILTYLILPALLRILTVDFRLSYRYIFVTPPLVDGRLMTGSVRGKRMFGHIRREIRDMYMRVRRVTCQSTHDGFLS